MANTVRLKRSAVQGKAPVVGDLELGELAVNTYDGKLYTKKNDGSDSVVEIGGGGSTDLSYTASTRELASSTGTNVTLPEVVASGDSGLITGADKLKIDNAITTGGDLSISNPEPTLDLSETDTTTAGRLRIHAGDVYLEAGAPTSGATSSSGDIRIQGYDGANVNEFTVKSGGIHCNVWHEGNMGTGSLLDADTVDGIQATSFIRLDATNDSCKGSIGFNSTLTTFDPPDGGTGTDTSNVSAISLKRGQKLTTWYDGYIRDLIHWEDSGTGGDVVIGQSGTALFTGIDLRPGSSGTAMVNGNRILDTTDEASYLKSDADDTKTSGYLRFDDNIQLQIGTGDDMTIRSNGTHVYFDTGSGADVYLTQSDVIKFKFSMTDGDFLVKAGEINFGASVRQMLNLYNATYGIGVQTNTMYHRSASRFSWFRGGTHINTENDAGTGGTVAMTLDGSSNLTVTGNVTAGAELTANSGKLNLNGLGDDYDVYADSAGNFNIRNETDARTDVVISGNGDMAIGTLVDSTYKLNVNGAIDSKPICASIYGAGTNTLGTSFETITLDYNLHNSDQVNHFLLSGTNGTQVKIPGLYRITFCIAFDATSGGTTSHNIAEAKLRVGFSDIDSTLVYIATNGSSYGENSVSNTVIMDLSANTYVELRARRATTNTSMICREHATTMTFERIGSA